MTKRDPEPARTRTSAGERWPRAGQPVSAAIRGTRPVASGGGLASPTTACHRAHALRTHLQVAIASVLLVTLAGCGSTPTPLPTPTPTPTPTTAVADAPVVSRFASPNPGSVNAYLIKTAKGIVLVDAERNTAGGRAVAQRVREAGEPLLAILVTHEHPDHIGGLRALRIAYPGVPVYASRRTVALMRQNPHDLYRAAHRDDPDFPTDLVYPDHLLGAEDHALEIGGTTFEVRQFPVGESGSATAYYLPATRDLFSGDLTANHVTPALIQGATCGWLDDLKTLHDSFPEAAMADPGHGSPSAAADQVDQTRAYLERVRSLVIPTVAQSSPAGREVSNAEQQAVLTTLAREFPGYPRVAALPTLAQANVAAVATEVRGGTENARCS